MKTAEYELRDDERTRFEKEIFMPVTVIFCIAAIVLYSISSSVPGQFTGRPWLQIPIWGALAAAAVLLAIWSLRWQRASKYIITDESLQVSLPVVTYNIPLSEIVEVVSVADRRAQPLMVAIVAGTFKRAITGFGNLIRRACGGPASAGLDPDSRYNFTTSDTGGARIVCKNGAQALVSPMDLSGFLRHLEAEFKEHGLPARVIREVAVQITAK
jgi:hypothetical protein